MSLLQHSGMQRLRNWCVAVVLLTTCSLTVSVVTRYCSPASSSAYSIRAVVNHASTDAQRQRLAKDAATWIAPVFCSALLPAPVSYPPIAAARPPLPALFFAEALYNRPPPSFAPLA
ncbi:MAG: hypothetical protein WAM69_13225 [Candidatus Sulfotelmatobacter sp.]